MKHTKRLLSVLLTLCMLLAAMPLTAFAEDCIHNYPYVCSTLCTLCGEVRTPEMEHTNYLSDCDETCGLCGEVRETTVPHESDGLPCVENVCKHCYAAIPATTDHTDEDGDYYCDVCWTWLGCDQGVHSRDGLPCQDTVCYYCGIEMPAEDHEIGGAAICVDNQCIYCGTSVPASADHNYQCYYEQEPTCVNDGKQYYECTQCYDRYTETIPTTGEHEDSDGDYWCDWCVLWLGCESGIHNRMHTILCMDSACSACGLAMPATEGHVSNNFACRDGWCVNGCDTLIPATADHTYDDAADPDCNVCGDEREIACVHEYDYDCDTNCNLCGEMTRPEAEHLSDAGTVYTRDDTHHGIYYSCQHCGQTIDAIAEEHADEDGDGACDVCDYIPCEEHVYDSNFDWYCNVCGLYRDVDVPMDVVGVSVSEDVNGLAMLFSAKVEGIAFDGTRILYDNATIGGHKLIGLGAVVSNNYDEVGYAPSLEDVDGVHVKDVPAVYAYDYDEATGTLCFAVRVINIPDEHKDTKLVFTPYFIFENNLGEQEAFSSNAWGDSYNRVANAAL